MLSFFTTAISFAAALTPVLGAPHVALREVEKFAGNVKENSYIVTMTDKTSRDSLVEGLGSSVTALYNRTSTGFASVLDDETLNNILAHPATVAEDGVVSINTVQTDAPWGLNRISQVSALSASDTSALTYTYAYNATGDGVDVYVVDTGIYTAHTTFGGRAVWGATFGGYADADGNGHGTHVSGTIGGDQYGVAKSVNLIAVKVLSDAGSGYISDILSGFDWIINATESSGRPSIVSMSLGGAASDTFDSGVLSLINASIHVVVAAGNGNAYLSTDGDDASGTSPARVAEVITVGATTIADAKATWSNYGSVVDIFAPGAYITSAWIGSPTATNNISGTSMATPHVSGIVAYLISQSGNTTPAAMSLLVKSLGVSGVLTSIPSGTSNLLANNGA
ncbi:peptidase 1 [Guyanagaster necrorhizus]|uniref:Peptidase 1 n=1 Tax=Guyanagaster necrorhizus TaxID=856835 RepID=A0A9P7VRX8_9AGAR|nr:peptidase 1 [Guyanagaster necrorhizus MCA 3950]KAG7445600.1 peptidase 1 [Guyanagaster necrorhizus MCA 3950]